MAIYFISFIWGPKNGLQHRLLRKKNPGTWNEECEEAFNKIKHYLQNPPLLVPPVSGKPLVLYLTVTEAAMGCVLGQHDETGRKERAIYYLSKKLTNVSLDTLR